MEYNNFDQWEDGFLLDKLIGNNFFSVDSTTFPTAPLGQARIIYDNTLGSLMISINGDDYQEIGSVIAGSTIFGESPTPAVDGVETVFTTANPYSAGTLKVTRASLRMHPTVDFSETSPAAGTFTMVSAPGSGEPLIVDYVKS